MTELACDCVNHAICFNGIGNSNITYCTLTNNSNGLGWPAVIETYDNKPIDWDKFFEQRNHDKKMIAEGTPRKECEGCNLIQKRPVENHKKIYYILLSSWQVCHSDCIYCLGHAPVIPQNHPRYQEHYDNYIEPYDVFSIVKDMVEKDILDKNAKIDFAGGEPTLYPRFNELLKYFVDNGYKNIVIHTNCITYSPSIEYGISKDAVSLSISMDAGSKKVHEKIKRVKSHDAVWKNFKQYVSAKPEDFNRVLGTKYVIVPGINDKEKEIKEWLKKSKKFGATEVILNVYNQLLNEQNYEPKLLDHLIKLSELTIKYAKKLNLPLKLYPNIEAAYIARNIEIPRLEN